MKILMVCLGNICRSPLAEGVMRHLAALHKLDWTVDSAGTAGWHVGKRPDSRSTHTARERGVDISRQTARQFKTNDFDDFDLILVMDRSNLQDVLAKARNTQDKEKVKLLLDNAEVPDPYYDDKLFEHVYELIEDACMKIINSPAP